MLIDVPYTIDTIDVSPDGKWVAYMSMESGGPEVWVAAFPSFTDRHKISAGEGTEPLWSNNGQEVVFVDSSSSLARVSVKPGPSPTFGKPESLMKVNAFRHNSTQQHYYAITPDAKRFLVRDSNGFEEADPIYVIHNWPSLLKK